MHAAPLPLLPVPPAGLPAAGAAQRPSGPALAGAVALVSVSTAALLASLALAAPPAGPLSDPTRPPAAVQAALAAAQPGGGLRPARADGPADAASAPVVAPLPLLQGVHLPASGAPTAMLDGRLLKVGDTIGERTVIGIDRQGVTLRGPGGTARVRLLGENTKQPPGSIVIGRSARFEPVEPAGTALAQARPDRPAMPVQAVNAPSATPATASEPAPADPLAEPSRP